MDELTPREREVLRLVGQGLTNQEIADRLVIAECTVRGHTHAIHSKLYTKGRGALVRAATYFQEAR